MRQDLTSPATVVCSVRHTLYIIIHSHLILLLMQDFIEMQQRQEAARQQTIDSLNEVLCRIISQPPGAASWHGTSRDLVELVDLAASRQTICDDRGIPFSRNALARKAFAATGLHMPAHVSGVVHRIRNRANSSYSLLTRWGRSLG